MYPLGVPTAEGIVSAIKYVFKFYEEIRQADKKFEVAQQILQSLDLTLSKLESIAIADTAVNFQVEAARDAWKALENYLRKFESEVGVKKHGKNAFTPHQKFRWALSELDGKGNELHHRINICLLVVMPMLQAATSEQVQKLSEDNLNSTEIILSALKSLKDEDSFHGTAHSNGIDKGSAEALITASIPCWQKKSGCLCRCHAVSVITHEQNRHFFVNTFGLSNLFVSCNVQACDSRRYGLQIRFATSKYGLPLAFNLALEFHSRWMPKFSLTPKRIVRYTSPGFTMLWELERKPLVKFDVDSSQNLDSYQRRHSAAVWQMVADIKHLFCNKEAGFADVDPAGEGWLEKILRNPWPLGLREAQWELIHFIISSSPELSLKNPKLLYRCAKWIGEGPHMAMLDTLLSLGVDPEYLHADLFQQWPDLSSPNWQSEYITPDPMFIEFMRKCLQITPGFAGCDSLSESVLTDSVSDFDRCLSNATNAQGLLRASHNALGQTAVHLAVCFPERLKRLLEAGMDPNAVDYEKSTPLMYAACYGQSDSVLQLLEHGAHPMLVDRRNGRTFIEYAISRNHINVVETLVESLRAQNLAESAIRVLDRALCGYFSSQSRVHDLESCILDRLFALGADPDVLRGNLSLLHYATFDTEIHKILQAGFTRANHRDKEGITPIMKVISRLNPKLLVRLLEIGADVNCQDNNGWTELHHLVRYASSQQLYGTMEPQDESIFHRRANMIKCIHLLLKAGADASIRDHCKCACSSEGCSPITVALHRTSRGVGSVMGSRILSGVVFDLFCALANRARSGGLRLILQDVTRYREFVESGLEHSCCYNEYLCYTTRNVQAIAAIRHAPFDCLFSNNGIEPVVTADEIADELGKIFSALERRAKECHDEMINRNRQVVNSIQFEVDHDADTVQEIYSFEMLPSLSKFDILGNRAWLTSIRALNRNGGLYQRGSLLSYIDDALHVLSSVQVSMQNDPL